VLANFDLALDAVGKEQFYKRLITEDFWANIQTFTDTLNEKKYKRGFNEQDDGFSTKELKELDQYFFDLQDKIEKSTGCPKGQMPYTMEDKERFQYLYNFSPAFSSKKGNDLRTSASPNDVATFVASLGKE
jgi:hypothetical protein